MCSINKAVFQSNMVMVRHLAEESVKAEDRGTAEIMFRDMMRSCRFLAKKFDFTWDEMTKAQLPRP